jgi:hypothetical protein
VRLLAFALLITACGSKPPPPKEPEPTPESIVFDDDPVAILTDLEERLAAADRVEIEADIHAEGALTADVQGSIHVERERVSWIKVKGWFVGQPVQAKWSSLTPVSGYAFDVQPPEWAEAILIGAMRMGALHNWAKVMDGKDPDTGNGDVRTWVTAEDVTWAKGGWKTRTLTWAIAVDGVRSAEAELELDERGLPLRRRVVVHFPQGEMRVSERYTRFEVVPWPQ